MKTLILNRLIMWKILTKTGYLNPLLLITFIFFTPTYFFTMAKIEHEKYYLNDEEIAALLMNDAHVANSDTIAVSNFEEKIAEEIQIGEKTISPKEYTSATQIVLPTEMVTKKPNNLKLLLSKAKSSPSKLTNWDMFRLKTLQMARNIKKKYPEINGSDEDIYNWSMKTFHLESGYDHKAVNKYTKAKGIFQAVPSTRRSMNIPHNLEKYSILKQVQYYELYISNCLSWRFIDKSKIDDACDWYFITFYPKYADTPDQTVVAHCNGYFSKKCPRGSYGNCAYHGNKNYDFNKDGKITKHEIKINKFK